MRQRVKDELRKEGSGGARPGAGRKPHRTFRNAMTLAQKYEVLPLDHMLSILNAPAGDKEVSNSRRDEMAKAAAPYIHPRLEAVSMVSEQDYAIDASKLTDDELATVTRLLAKAQVPIDERSKLRDLSTDGPPN